MSRRLNPCRSCSGMTRHDDRRCSYCRTGTGLFMLPGSSSNPPDFRDLRDAVRLDRYLELRQPVSWRGRGG